MAAWGEPKGERIRDWVYRHPEHDVLLSALAFAVPACVIAVALFILFG